MFKKHEYQKLPYSGDKAILNYKRRETLGLSHKVNYRQNNFTLPKLHSKT